MQGGNGANSNRNAHNVSVSENVENVRNRLAASADANSSAARSSAGDNATSPEAMFAELQALRKKYDAVVEYTVHLTAERDAIVTQLDLSQRELTKEKSKKKGDTAGGNSKTDKDADKKVIEKVCHHI
jgi:hypothetical protein